MATYATEQQLRDYCADNQFAKVPDDSDAVERLLERSERRLDGLIGPRPVDPSSGLKYAPTEELSDAQAAALSRACCACAEHELTVGPTVLVGADDYYPTEAFTLLRRAERQPLRALEELDGHDLLTYSGCAPPS
jgi:hypothetical protein